MSNLKNRLKKKQIVVGSNEIFDKTKQEIGDLANILKEFKDKFEKSYLPQLDNPSYDFDFISKNLEEAIILLEDIDDQLIEE